MKPWPITLFLLLNLFVSLSSTAAGPRDAQWAEVRAALAQGLPRTALERLPPLIDAAIQAEAWGEAARAIAQRVTIEAALEGGLPEVRIDRYRAALPQSPEPVRPVLHALLAHAYWAYFDQNRWRVQQRTATPGDANDDFRTWDLRRLFAAIDASFQAALAQPAALQALPIARFDGLLEPGTVPDRFRPTLHDFLAHEALTFYAAGEQAGARPEDAWFVPSDSPALAPRAAFLTWNPPPTDTNSVAFKAVRVFQQLLRLHEPDADPSALLDADLARLRFFGNVATGADRDEQQRRALEAFAEAHASHELSALALHAAAQIRQGRGEPAEAHRLATLGARAFPESPGGRLCRNLIASIEAPTLRIQAEKVWCAPWPDLAIHHTNLRQVHFRIVRSNWDLFLDRRRRRPESMTSPERVALLREAAVHAWSVDLPATPDFKERRTGVTVPGHLAPGFYFVLASRRADFAEDENEVTYSPFWVSDLALVVQTRGIAFDGWVLDAERGTPVAGAKVESWYLDETGQRRPHPATTTDANGAFTFAAATSERGARGHLFKATLGSRVIATGSDLAAYGFGEPPGVVEQTLFFTDRALYRPGQNIHYKGLCLVSRAGDRSYSTLSYRTVTVVFRDANGQEVSRASHRANDFGSFSGSFTTPRGTLTGHFSITIEDGPPGSHSVQVEEYKRPRFETVLDPAREGGRLGAEVRIPGRATTYAGTPVDAAKVRWTVRRQMLFPLWWGWHRRPHPSGLSPQEIAHGEATTRADGSFEIAFTATADPQSGDTPEATFSFEVTADVTDSAGETRSASRAVRFGRAAIAIESPAPDWTVARQAFPLRITTRTLDELPVRASGVVKIHRVRQPDRVQRPTFDEPAYPRSGRRAMPSETQEVDRWPLSDLVAEVPFTTTATNGLAEPSFTLAAGPYRAVITADDGQGRTVTAEVDLRVRDPEAPTGATRVPIDVAAPTWTVEPGGEFMALWGTGYDSGRALIQVEHRQRIIQQAWTPEGRTQFAFRMPVTEAMRGGFTFHVLFVRENRIHRSTHRVDVPWSNQQLELAWSTFRSRVEPGQAETWSLIVKPPRGGPALTAEMVATLYDASLDQFLPTSWPDGFGVFHQDYSVVSLHFGNDATWLDRVHGRFRVASENVSLTYRHFPAELVERRGNQLMRPMPMARGGMAGRALAESAPTPTTLNFAMADASLAAAPAAMTGAGGAMLMKRDAGAGPEASARAAAPPEPALRRNLQETAFFLPHLLTDSDGTVRLEFRLPDALTRWRFIGFAHDQRLRAGRLEGQSVAARDLMVLPNPPRFVREGDEIEFSARVINKSEDVQTGTARLALTFATGPGTGTSANAALGVENADVSFDLAAGATRAVTWRLKVPDGAGFLAYEVSAQGARHRDGEAGVLPVLSRRVLLTESLPLPIRGPGERTFTFQALKDAAASPTLAHERLTVQMASNPAWYAVLALPVLMEYPHECAEQVFNRLYANALGHSLTARDPRIARTFELWRNTPALQSPLEKNEDLKAVALAETPWVRDAKSESETRRNLGLLFDPVRTRSETDRALRKLSEMMRPDGGWSWFEGGPYDEFITTYVVAGFGRLRQLGVEVPLDAALRSIGTLDLAMHERWQRLKADQRLDRENVTPQVAFYLYARSFFLPGQPVAAEHVEAFRYWAGQAQDHWLKLDHRLPQGHVALALQRIQATGLAPALRPEVPAAIVRSLGERAARSEELGMSWREDELSASWFRAPIETQALMIEVFDEIARDAAAVEELKVWLLKQKQTQGWKSTKATADAVYALLRRGVDLLADATLVEVKVGGRSITPAAGVPGAGSALEPGTGFFETRYARGEIAPALAAIDVRKTTPGIAWGAAHWQYFEDLSNVRPHQATPLTLEKALFRKVPTAAGAELRPAAGTAKVGDELVMRVTLRTDRDLEYVHLKDQRGSGTEPVNVLSGYRFQDGFGYYESTRDTASHFFISYLPKGTYVFEYAVRVQLRGRYTAGIAEVQCLYAPEFNSHSAGTALTVE